MPAADNEDSWANCGEAFPLKTQSLHRTVVSRAAVRWWLQTARKYLGKGPKETTESNKRQLPNQEA
eukprot:7983804-Lingulodinium_polyedra.AAC.1